MKGNVQLKDTQQTYDMLDKCYVVVSKLSLDDMRTVTETSYKWRWDKLWFVKEEKPFPVANFLYQHRRSVIKFIKELKDCIKQNGEVGLSLTSYNELVKLSRGDIEVNSYWILDY